METVNKFRMEPIPKEGLHSNLVFNETLTLQVEGQTIEAQFRCSSGYLVVTADGNPYEEMIHFYLLDSEGSLLDQVSLGQIYHSGILRDIDLKSDDRIEFTFFGTERWRLLILGKPRFELPRLFSSVRRTSGWLGLHYLILQKCS